MDRRLCGPGQLRWHVLQPANRRCAVRLLEPEDLQAPPEGEERGELPEAREAVPEAQRAADELPPGNPVCARDPGARIGEARSQPDRDSDRRRLVPVRNGRVI